jgi:predicted ArsR family transcriptional regulator
MTRSDPPANADAWDRREVILDMVRASATPVGVGSMAQEMGVHPNTVRFHLDALIASGRVERVLGQTHGPGRPPIGYRTTRSMNRDGPSNYQLLATILTGYFAASTATPGAAATQVGRSWGPSLIETRGRARSKTEALTRVVGVLADLGFEPEPISGPRATQLRLRHCPFLDLVDEHADIICSLHLGLMQGALAALRGPVTVDRLDPFVEPDLCVAHVVSAGP